jgi:lantibiotic biosynthesis dehydratase-like protein
VTWVSLHAFHDGDLDDLLLGGVRPLVGELYRESLIDGFFYLRYWDGGRHLRIRLSCPRPGPVRDLALPRLREQLAAMPPGQAAEPGAYAAAAAVLAEREGMTDYLRAPLPPGTVHEIDYRPEYGRYGTGSALATAERHFAESSRIALGLIAAGADRGRRHIAAFCALVLAWHGTPVRAPEPDSGHEEHYLARRAVLHDLAGRMGDLAAGTSDLPGTGALTAWWRTVTTLPDPAVRDLCAHLLCNRLGIAFGEEHRLRYLARRTLTSESEDR